VLNNVGTAVGDRFHHASGASDLVGDRSLQFHPKALRMSVKACSCRFVGLSPAWPWKTSAKTACSYTQLAFSRKASRWTSLALEGCPRVGSFTKAKPILRIQESCRLYSSGDVSQAWRFHGDLDPESTQAHAVPPCQTVDHTECCNHLGPYSTQCSWDSAL
jgi:hypothetical protein